MYTSALEPGATPLALTKQETYVSNNGMSIGNAEASTIVAAEISRLLTCGQ